MFGQLRNNFRPLGAIISLGAAVSAMSSTAWADTVSGHLAVADWYMIVKDEGGAPSVVQKSSLSGQWNDVTAVNFDLTVTPQTLASNNVYIIAVGQSGGAMMAYLSGMLTGDKSVLTGSPDITILTSDQEGCSFPEDAEIPELIKGQLGGSYQPTQTVARDAVKNIESLAFPEYIKAAAGGQNPPAIWSSKPNYDSEFVVFKIPYSALFNASDESGGSSSNEDEFTLAMTREDLLKERKGMRSYIGSLTNIIKEREHEMRVLNAQLDFAKNGTSAVSEVFGPMQKLIDTQKLRLDTQAETLAENISKIDDLKTQIDTQKNKLDTQTQTLTENVSEISGLNKRIKTLQNQIGFASPPALIGGGLGLLGLGGLAGLMLGRNRHNKHCELPLPPLKKEEEEREKSQGFETLKKGMCFAASPMLLGGLPPALAAIKPVYDAVGRIGFAQKGKPIGEDESFGTGILVSDRHILTNRHVWEMFKHRLLSDEGTGIEFYGEKKSDKSDFIPFDGAEPICIEGWDAAIFTLSRPPENRAPVSITPRPAEQLNDLDIVVVGYPQAHRMTEDIEQVTEKDAVFGVKRYSEGKIFRHSVDIENPYGVEAAVEAIINPAESLRAICHNASTLGGSSGSAVICKKTGDLVALHFGFDSAYEWEEAANFALAGENLAESVTKIISNVTYITDKSES